jgi:hypothetical protein
VSKETYYKLELDARVVRPLLEAQVRLPHIL